MYYTDNIACPIYVDFIMVGKIITVILTKDGGMEGGRESSTDCLKILNYP